jgi:hypothetical protein
MSMSADAHIERLIDETARGMTEGAPAGDIPAAVRRHLTGDRRAAATWRPRLAAAVAAGAVLVMWNLMLPEPAPPTLQSGTRFGELMVAIPGDLGSRVPRAQAVPGPTGPSAARRTAQLPPVAPIVVLSLEVQPLAGSGPMETQIVDVPMPLLADRLEIEPLVIH